MPTALITGITGQDGSYLAELLLSKGYHVHGVMRRNSQFTTGRLDHIWQHMDQRYMHYGDMTDATSLRRILDKTQPHEIYNLAAQSHVAVSFECPEYTAAVVGMGALNLLEAARGWNRGGYCRIYQASSSEMFGASPPPQNESTPFYPRSPYACAKVMAFDLVRNYREAYGLHASNGILFNHESPRRGETFVTRKVTRAAARCKLGLQDKVYLGNLDAERDWGFAGDFVEAMWLMLQQDGPGDYVIATGEKHSVRDLAEAAFAHVGLDWRDHVSVSEKYYRPTEVESLHGDATKAREQLGWSPRTTFRELIAMMVESDLKKERI